MRPAQDLIPPKAEPEPTKERLDRIEAIRMFMVNKGMDPSQASGDSAVRALVSLAVRLPADEETIFRALWLAARKRGFKS